MYGLWVVFLVIAGRAKVTRRNFPAALVGLVVNLVLLTLLVPSYGIVGAGVALCGAYAAMLVVMHLLVRGAFSVTFEWRRLTHIAVLIGVLRRHRRHPPAHQRSARPDQSRGGVRRDPAGAVAQRLRPPRGARAGTSDARAGTKLPKDRMTRPGVSVVVPFAGDPVAGRQALEMLRALDTRDGDELILSDNSGTVPSPLSEAPVTIIRATGRAVARARPQRRRCARDGRLHPLSRRRYAGTCGPARPLLRASGRRPGGGPRG